MTVSLDTNRPRRHLAHRRLVRSPRCVPAQRRRDHGHRWQGRSGCGDRCHGAAGAGAGGQAGRDGAPASGWPSLDVPAYPVESKTPPARATPLTVAFSRPGWPASRCKCLRFGATWRRPDHHHHGRLTASLRGTSRGVHPRSSLGDAPAKARGRSDERPLDVSAGLFHRFHEALHVADDKPPPQAVAGAGVGVALERGHVIGAHGASKPMS